MADSAPRAAARAQAGATGLDSCARRRRPRPPPDPRRPVHEPRQCLDNLTRYWPLVRKQHTLRRGRVRRRPFRPPAVTGIAVGGPLPDAPPPKRFHPVCDLAGLRPLRRAPRRHRRTGRRVARIAASHFNVHVPPEEPRQPSAACRRADQDPRAALHLPCTSPLATPTADDPSGPVELFTSPVSYIGSTLGP